MLCFTYSSNNRVIFQTPCTADDHFLFSTFSTLIFLKKYALFRDLRTCFDRNWGLIYQYLTIKSRNGDNKNWYFSILKGLACIIVQSYILYFMALLCSSFSGLTTTKIIKFQLGSEVSSVLCLFFTKKSHISEAIYNWWSFSIFHFFSNLTL